ncbi:PEP-CTERM sorting domain-containing protein [Xylophilus sp. GOD-11R]|uniref:PEP-CTERM sorting domain-containing protein n=1 Tax=Xylophilus sp. GOD-11R TaxID=3089814 RepID=UPI00298D326B|nr:PEP-CTERM sorting domain-containing protein [Xylophilus sp. GOD-11R]WPB55339.1 PEP-CTERM sorting domain-containing protein [Xylophilus sp. GOD-11R]
MKKLKFLALSALVVCSASHAAYVNLQSFVPTEGLVTIALDFLGLAATGPRSMGDMMFPAADARGYINVTNLQSFEYQTSGTGTSIYFSTMPHQQMINIASNEVFSTYTFATPYTGALKFNVVGATSETMILSLQRFKTAPLAAVPEPETYAMFMAGLAVAGIMARRRKDAVAHS